MKEIFFNTIFFLLLLSMDLEGGEPPAYKDEVRIDFDLKELGIKDHLDCDFQQYTGKAGGGSWTEPGKKDPWTLNLQAELQSRTKDGLSLKIRVFVPIKNAVKNRFDLEDMEKGVLVPKNGQAQLSFGHGITVNLRSTSNRPDTLPDEPLQIPAPPEPSLELNLLSNQKVFKTGDPIPLIFQIKNTGQIPYRYMSDDGNLSFAWRFKVIKEPGIPIPVSRPDSRLVSYPVAEMTVQPGAGFEKVIPLNRRIFPLKEGKYSITGFYSTPRQEIQSKPIKIEITPRSEKEMAKYIGQLSTDLKKTGDRQEQEAILQKLAFTGDRQIMPLIIEEWYGSRNPSFWSGEAFLYFLPKDSDVTQFLLKTATEKGLAQNMFWTLKERGASIEEIKPAIAASLSAEHPDSWAEGALAAQHYADDSFTSRLVVLAEDPKSKGRQQAIYALALNRTELSLACLKRLLDDPQPQIRLTTAEALTCAYRYRGNSLGRPLLAGDFDSKYQKSKQ